MRLRRIEPVLRRALRGPCRVPEGATILVAVSGGADSTALLLGLARLSHEFAYRISAAHFHHGLRAAADADLEFVRALCRRLQVPLLSARWNTRARMRRRGWSGHEGLRRLRRQFLEDAARRTGARAIATGHHAQDQLETVLMRMLRGSGLRGLGGMSARRGPWIRPLLAASRDQIEADLLAVAQPWRDDPSNSDPAYLRARVRSMVLPALLRASGPDATRMANLGLLARRVARGLGEVRHARRHLDRLAGVWIASAGNPPSGAGQVLDCLALRSCPPAVRRAVLRQTWLKLGPGEGLSQVHLDSLEALLTGVRPARVSLPGGFEGRRQGSVLRIGPRSDSIHAAPRGTCPVGIPDRVDWGGLRVETRWVSGVAARRDIPSKSRSDEVFAAEQLKGSLQLRPAAPDELFVPFGLRKPRKLRDFLRKQRVPAGVRKQPLVLADEEGILSVIGVRRSARAPLDSTTRRAIWVHYQP